MSFLRGVLYCLFRRRTDRLCSDEPRPRPGRGSCFIPSGAFSFRTSPPHNAAKPIQGTIRSPSECRTSINIIETIDWRMRRIYVVCLNLILDLKNLTFIDFIYTALPLTLKGRRRIVYVIHGCILSANFFFIKGRERGEEGCFLRAEEYVLKVKMVYRIRRI